MNDFSSPAHTTATTHRGKEKRSKEEHRASTVRTAIRGGVGTSDGQFSAPATGFPGMASELSPPRRPMRKLSKALLPHEQALLRKGALRDVSHPRASSVWLSAPSRAHTTANNADPRLATSLLYRVMGDTELLHLLATNALPGTQAYQSIQEGPAGREYSEKYLRGHKWVATAPTTVVEFRAPRALRDALFAVQSKIEDGCRSHGLGNKAGRTLPHFNAALTAGTCTWRLVTVKRGLAPPAPPPPPPQQRGPQHHWRRQQHGNAGENASSGRRVGGKGGKGKKNDKKGADRRRGATASAAAAGASHSSSGVDGGGGGAKKANKAKKVSRRSRGR